MEAGVEGRLQIDLYCRKSIVSRVGIHSTRPLLLPRIFFGKNPTEVIATLPLIYSVCGVAQRCAAAEALEQAISRPASRSYLKRRRLLVALETLKEHIWRIELDWARFLDRPADGTGITWVVSMMNEFRVALFAEQDPFTLGGLHVRQQPANPKSQLDTLDRLLAARIFSLPVQRWLKIADLKALSEWSRERTTLAQEMLFQIEKTDQAGLGQSHTAALGILDIAYLEQCLGGADAHGFIAHPVWQTAPAETTPYTRRCDHPILLSLAEHYGNGLLTRLTARLVELALLAVELRSEIAGLGSPDTTVSSTDLETGIGISQIEAARGRLVHRVELKGGLISNYQILAPTEWNFHPEGVLAGGLLGMVSTNETGLKRRADMLINAIDPCVGYQLRINHSDIDLA
ncbi:MAG: hypothetical protein GY792_21260 [Gammaproteobacteria bacterium]|nr:hypothetical protein [Gammaproteobacteria bacterium]